MRINFRQGLVSSEINGAQQPNYLVTAPNGIMIRTANRPTIFTVADGQKNYTVSFTADVLAWPSSMYRGVQEAWLYIDINRSTSQRTYGITTVAPQYGLTAPKYPTYGQHWFDTRQCAMKVFNETNSWQRVLRVIAGKYTPTRTTPMHVGTQIGIEGNYLSGSIMTDGFNKAIVDSKGQFITTEDVVMIEGAATHAVKLESNVDVAPAKVSVPAFHVVAYGNDGKLRLADYDDVGVNVIGLSISNAVPGEPVSLVMQGKVHNTLWNWPRANMTLWVGRNGELTPVDPFAEGGRAKRRVPVARTIDVDTVLFDQGLGGVGEKGDSGDVVGIQPMSPTVQGIGKLTVPAVDQRDPIVVGDNDPRMSDARVPLAHEHHATHIVTDQFGEFQGENAQQALEYLDASIADKVVNIKRVTTNAEIDNVVAAFNALSVQERTLRTNQVLIVEWTTDVYVWGGGYGSPVSATTPDQFLLVGKLVADATAVGFSIRAINAVTAYEAPKYSDLWIRHVLPEILCEYYPNFDPEAGEACTFVVETEALIPIATDTAPPSPTGDIDLTQDGMLLFLGHPLADPDMQTGIAVDGVPPAIYYLGLMRFTDDAVRHYQLGLELFDAANEIDYLPMEYVTVTISYDGGQQEVTAEYDSELFAYNCSWEDDGTMTFLGEPGHALCITVAPGPIAATSSPCGDNTVWGSGPVEFGIDTQYDVDGNAFTWNSDAGAWKHGTLVGTAPDLVTGMQLAGSGSTVEFSVEFSELPNAVSGASFIGVMFSNDIMIQLRPSYENGLFWHGQAGDIPNGTSNFFDGIICVGMSPSHPH